MKWSFRTSGNYIEFVNTDETALHVESVVHRLHNTSRCIDWSLPTDTTRITFTIDESKYENILITDIDFDGSVMNEQADFETGITAMFTGLAGGSGGGVESVTAVDASISIGGTATNPTVAAKYLVFDSRGNFPATGVTGKVYLAEDIGGRYKWTGSEYEGIAYAYEMDGDNYFAAENGGAEGMYVYANILSGSGMGADWELGAVADELSFYETGFFSNYYKEAAVWRHVIDTYDGENNTMRTRVQGNADGIELVILSMPSSTVLFSIEIDATTGYKFSNLQEFADNAAAISGGLPVGGIYRTAGAMKIVI